VPKRPAELFTVEEVRRRITDAIGAFWVDADRHREVIAGYAEAYEPGKPVRLSLPPLHLLTPTPGTGKTHSAIESLGVGIPAAGAAGQRIWYFVQSHKIAMERVGEFDRTHKGAFKAIAFRGRGATDYDVELPGGGHPELCRRYDVTKALGEAEMSPGHEVCRDCHHRGHADPLLACGYVDQIPTGTDVIFAAYNYMFIPGAQKVFGDVPPYAVIVDENAVPSAIEGGDGERSLNLDDVNKVPIEPLAEYLGKSAAAEFLDKLAPILAAVAKETPIGQRATVPTATLTDAGIEYELVRAAANQLEYEKVEANLPRSTAKTNRDREIIEAVANFAPAVQRRRRQHRLAEIVKATIDAGHGDVPGLRVERREASPGEVHSRVTMAWRRRLADALVNTPVLMLDATADVGQVAAMFGHARIVRHTHLEADLPNSWVRFVQWSASSEKLTPDDGDSEATKGAATNHRRELYELIRYRAWQFRWHVIGLGRRKNCLIVVTKKLYKLISKEFHHQPDNVEIRHHGSLAGSNVFGDYDYILDLSGMRPLPEQLEIQAEALYGRPVHRLGYHQNGRPVWPKPVGGALRRRGEALGEVIDTPRHPDSLVEPFRWRVYEGEKFQVVHRGRPVNRDRLTSLVVETVGNAVPPFEIDEFVESWGENLPSDMEMLRAAGIVPAEGARGRSKAIYRLRRDRPKPWKSEDAAAEWLRANPQPQISLRDKESSPLSFFIEKSGVEGRWPSFRIRVSGDRFAVPYDVDLPTGMVGADRPAGTDEGVSERIRKQLEHHDMKLDQIELAELPFIAVGDRLAELTMPDQIPTRAEAGEFIGEALRFFAMLDARADAEAGRLTLAAGATLPPLPDWWSASPPPRIPPGRRFLVRYRAGDGWISLWHFPDADGGLWADLEMRPVEPPPAVREYAAAQTGG